MNIHGVRSEALFFTAKPSYEEHVCICIWLNISYFHDGLFFVCVFARI